MNKYFTKYLLGVLVLAIVVTGISLIKGGSSKDDLPAQIASPAAVGLANNINVTEVDLRKELNLRIAPISGVENLCVIFDTGLIDASELAGTEVTDRILEEAVAVILAKNGQCTIPPNDPRFKPNTTYTWLAFAQIDKNRSSFSKKALSFRLTEAVGEITGVLRQEEFVSEKERGILGNLLDKLKGLFTKKKGLTQECAELQRIVGTLLNRSLYAQPSDAFVVEGKIHDFASQFAERGCLGSEDLDIYLKSTDEPSIRETCEALDRSNCEQLDREVVMRRGNKVPLIRIQTQEEHKKQREAFREELRQLKVETNTYNNNVEQ